MRGKAQYLTLDAMRGIAAISVIWFHLHFILGYDSAGCLAVDGHQRAAPVQRQGGLPFERVKLR